MTTRELTKSELAGAFVVLDPEWRNKIFFGGLLLLFLHPIGWPAALGYRKVLISNLASGTEPILPEWKGNIVRFFLEGMKAMGVIFGYLSPLYLALFILLLSNGQLPNEYWFYSALFFVVLMIFSTLSFPLALTFWSFFSNGYRIPLGTAGLFFAIFSLIIFFIPAGFLQVSRTGRYLSAFNIPAAFSTLVGHFRSYVLAWYHSVLMSLSGHFALPFAPWGVVWCYLGIIFEFNSILQSDNVEESNRSWFNRILRADRLLIQQTDYTAVYRCLNPADAAECLLLKIGPIMIPLPTVIVNQLSKARR
jgi:hypothetical protein